MTNSVTPFDFKGHPVRTVVIDGDPWFVVADLCRVLGHTNPTVAREMVDVDDRRSFSRSEALNFDEVFADRRVQSANLVNESGMYALIFGSNLASAREFKHWVTREVLPSIRSTGVYLGDLDLATALEKYAATLREKDRAIQYAIAAEARVAELTPVANEWYSYMDLTGTCSLGELAQALGGGRTRLVSRLRELGVLVTKEASQGGTRPTQPYSENEGGWFVVKSDMTNIGPILTAYATPKGVSSVFRLLVKHGMGEHRWGPIPTEEDLFTKLAFSA